MAKWCANTKTKDRAKQSFEPADKPREKRKGDSTQGRWVKTSWGKGHKTELGCWDQGSLRNDINEKQTLRALKEEKKNKKPTDGQNQGENGAQVVEKELYWGGGWGEGGGGGDLGRKETNEKI